MKDKKNTFAHEVGTFVIFITCGMAVSFVLGMALAAGVEFFLWITN